MPNKKIKTGGNKNGDTFKSPFFIFAIIGVFVVAGGLWVSLGSGGNEMIVSEPEPVAIKFDYEGPRHPLSGERLDSAEDFSIFAVMVENSRDAQPLSGVEEASVIIEAPVEGNITRWMALFTSDQDVDKIGPVRSARPYYVDYALGWDVLYAHVGGSPEALELIDTLGLADLNEFYNGGSFWRARDRYAPHNAYTETSRLYTARNRIMDNNAVSEFDMWQYKDDSPGKDDRPDAHEVNVEFNGYYYDVAWEYDPETNQYTRYQGGEVHEAASYEDFMADNIAIVKTDMEVIDNVGRQKITTLGSGEAVILIDGEVIEGLWRKDSRMDMLRFYNKDGDEVKFNVGKTWIEIVNEDKEVSISK